MKRVNATLDERTIELLRRLGERLGIADRSSVIRHITARVAREERIELNDDDKEES